MARIRENIEEGLAIRKLKLPPDDLEYAATLRSKALLLHAERRFDAALKLLSETKVILAKGGEAATLYLDLCDVLSRMLYVSKTMFVVSVEESKALDGLHTAKDLMIDRIGSHLAGEKFGCNNEDEIYTMFETGVFFEVTIAVRRKST